MGLLKDISKDIKKYKKFFIPVVIIIALVLIYALWYYSPLYTYGYQQKIDKVNSLTQEEKYDEAWNFIQRAFNADERANMEDLVLNTQKKKALEMLNNEKPLKIINKKISGNTLKIQVKNIGNRDIDYVKYNIYYYDTKDGSGGIIGTDWGNCSNPIPPSAMTEMESYVNPPTGAKYYTVEIKEWS
ncbi:hypothetical protein AB8I98_002347 [Clostridium perfringens]